MGSGSWSSSAYNSSTTDRATRGVRDFAYHHDYQSGKVHNVHPDLDPSLLKGGVRESRDSAEHPESLPIAIFFDVTGSMGSVPVTLQKKLTKLMDIILEKTSVRHPQIIVGAIGDAICDSFPFQVGQFESDNRFDEQLRNIILEGGGGGQVFESYGLAHFFAAKCVVADSFSKRHKKGYLFTMGDELFWPVIKSRELDRVFGKAVSHNGADYNVRDLVEEAKRKWEVFHLHAMDGSYPDNETILRGWSALLGERFIKVRNSSLVCEVIAGIIYGLEASKTAQQVVEDMGLSGSEGDDVSAAIGRYLDWGTSSVAANA